MKLPKAVLMFSWLEICFVIDESISFSKLGIRESSEIGIDSLFSRNKDNNELLIKNYLHHILYRAKASSTHCILRSRFLLFIRSKLVSVLSRKLVQFTIKLQLPFISAWLSTFPHYYHKLRSIHSFILRRLNSFKGDSKIPRKT